MTDPKTRSLLRARAAEQEGKPAEAVEHFKAAGQPEEAARVLAQLGRPAEAAKLLLASLGVRPAQAAQLDLGMKKRALKAAIALARAGETTQAVEWFLALGERGRAVQALEKAGDHLGAVKLSSSPGLMMQPSAPSRVQPASQSSQAAASASLGQADSPVQAHKLESAGKGEQALEMWTRLKRFGDAARVAKALGRQAEAAQLYADAGMWWESAQAFRPLGELHRCLESLLQVQRGDPRYRAAAAEAIHLSFEQDQVAPTLPPFLATFVRSGPQSEKEMESFDELSRLYLRHDSAASAREVLGQMVERSPKWRDAGRRLQALSRELPPAQSAAVRAALAAGAARPAALPANPMDGLPELPAFAAPPEPPKPVDSSLFFGEVPQPFEELEPLDAEAEPGDEVELVPLDGEPIPVSAAVVAAASIPPPTQASAPPPVSGAASVPASASAPAPASAPASASASGTGSAPAQASDKAAARPPAPRPPPLALPTPPPPVAPARPGAPAPRPPLPVPAAALAAAQSPLARMSNPGGRAAAALFKPGLLIAERYRLEEKIGQGGMAAVFRATDLELEDQVALKVFSGVEQSEVAVARFKQELKLSRQLSHPNIIRLYDIGLYEGHRYISMELLRGRSLKARMAEPFGFHEALRLLEQACLGLQAAHDHGVIHRDIKPDNFFLTEDGVLKVMDFGIAKHQAAAGVTVAGSIAGTPAYMSPEQISNFSTVTHKTDLYALGVMAYEIFTGTQPFVHEELVPLLLLHVNQAPEPPRQRNPGVPEELEEVILRLLAKDPARRHASAHDVAEDLARIRRSYGG